MHSLSHLLLALTGTALLTSSAPLSPRQPACAPVHILIARASFEPRGEGLLLPSLANLIVDAHPGTTREAIDYPASVTPYDESSAKGTKAVTAQLTSYVTRCPESKVVLLGYSQGAHILGDSLCGGGGYPGIGPPNEPIDPAVGEKVVAVIQMGDTRHLANASYNVGTATRDGAYPRQLPHQSCDRYASRIQSYCDRNDQACDSGNDPIFVHSSYTRTYNRAAAAFVSSKIRAS